MKINSLQNKYVQKSKIFAYPLLGIPRGTSIVPKEVYLSWEDNYTVEDTVLICNYELRDDPEYKYFEEKKLLKHPMFLDMHVLENNTAVYVFDFSKYHDDFQKVILGKYINLSLEYKNLILRFFKNNPNNYHLIMSYLYPENYYREYSELLNVKEELLRNVGNLCSPPDLGKECLTLKKKVNTFEPITN
jgi:hypothetical protein